MNIGERIRKTREEKGISQTALAEMVGITKQSLYKYENSIITNIPSNKIESIARKLETTPAYLMGWSENSEKKNDIISDIVLRFRSDDEFRELVTDLYNASTEQLNVVKAVSSAFKQH